MCRQPCSVLLVQLPVVGTLIQKVEVPAAIRCWGTRRETKVKHAAVTGSPPPLPLQQQHTEVWQLADLCHVAQYAAVLPPNSSTVHGCRVPTDRILVLVLECSLHSPSWHTAGKAKGLRMYYLGGRPVPAPQPACQPTSPTANRRRTP